MAENGLEIQPVPNHLCLSGGRHEGISFMGFGFHHVHVKKHVEMNFSLEICNLSYKHGLYRRCDKPCKATKEKFDPCSSIKQSKVVSEVLLKVSVGFKIVFLYFVASLISVSTGAS